MHDKKKEGRKIEDLSEAIKVPIENMYEIMKIVLQIGASRKGIVRMVLYYNACGKYDAA